MGVGSAFYNNYYMGLGLVYILVGIIPIAQMPVLNTCKSICPLKFADRDWKLWACDLQKQEWNTEAGYRNAWLSFDQNVTGPCFVCQTPEQLNVIQPCVPCETYKDPVPSTRYSKSTSCTIDTISQCSLATPPNYRPADLAASYPKQINGRDKRYSPEFDIQLRGQMVGQTIFIAVIYLIQGIGCMVAGCGSGRFAQTFEDDWLKMTLCDKLIGCLVKFFPAINRCLNFFQLGSLLFCGFAIYIQRTCEDAINDYSEKVFFPFMQFWLALALVVWGLFCITGNIIRAKNNKDPAFIVPLPDVKSRGPVGYVIAKTKFYCIKYCGKCGGP
jgi:hypothetical protein